MNYRLKPLITGFIVSTMLLHGPISGMSREPKEAEKTPEQSHLGGLQKEKLPNDLEVIFYESHKVPLVTIVLTVKAGGRSETPDTDGLTHLWEHMFFKGNAKLPDQEAFNKRIRELGIVFNGDTSAEKVRYYFTLPSVYLEEGLEFMANAIATPLLEEKELNREIKVVLDEYDRNASQPYFELYKARQKLIYGDKAFLRDPLGQRHVISATTRKKLLQIKDDVFVPANSAIIIAGDIDPKATSELVKKYFSSWKNPDNWKPLSSNKFPPFPKKETLVKTHTQAGDPNLSFIFQGPTTLSDPQSTYRADILISLLSMRSGTFYRKYIDSGLATYAGLSFHTQSQAGELIISAQTSAENFRQVREMLLKEPQKWLEQDDYFSNEQLDDVKRSLIIGQKYEINQPSSYAKTLGFWWAVTGLDYYDNYINNLRSVTLKDIKSFVNDYLIEKPYITTILAKPNDANALKLESSSQELQRPEQKGDKS